MGFDCYITILRDNRGLIDWLRKDYNQEEIDKFGDLDVIEIFRGDLKSVQEKAHDYIEQHKGKEKDLKALNRIEISSRLEQLSKTQAEVSA